MWIPFCRWWRWTTRWRCWPSAFAPPISQIAGSAGRADAASILLPIAYNIAAVALGAGMAFLLKWGERRVTSRYNRLLMVVILLLTLSGLCAAVDISPLLACMALGMVHANISRKGEALFKAVERFTPPVLTFFFVVSGMRLNVPALKTAGVIGVSYFFVRILGKYAGAAAGALLTGEDKSVRRYLGLALVPQAGVSIGLAALGERMLPPEMGSLLNTIVLSSAVLYEIAGPGLAKLALHLAGALKPAEKEAWQRREGKRAGRRIARGTGASVKEIRAAARPKTQELPLSVCFSGQFLRLWGLPALRAASDAVQNGLFRFDIKEVQAVGVQRHGDLVAGAGRGARIDAGDDVVDLPEVER